MKTRLSFLIAFFAFSFLLYPCKAQVQQGFNYQAVARDPATGFSITGSPMKVQLTIQTDSFPGPGTILWQETHNVTTNNFGLFDVIIGKGSRVTGATSFSQVDWTAWSKYYIKTEIEYPLGVPPYKLMGVSRLWSVPFAMVAGDFGGPVKKLSVAGKTSIMDEALFEVKNNMGQTVFAVYNEGVRVYVADGNKGLKGGFSVGGFGTDKTGESQKYLTVSKDSVTINLDTNPLTKAVKGGFAVGGYDLTKGLTQNFLNVTSDSVRIYVNNKVSDKGVKGGFAVGGFDVNKRNPQNLLTVSDDSVRIYINNDNKKAVKGGFSVGGFGTDKADRAKFLNIATDNSGIVKPAENRILWYPRNDKNAFLAGRVLIQHPDSIGINSVTTGYESRAKGGWSQAMGYMAIARGDYSTAIGKNAFAGKPNSFAFGDGVSALNQYSYSFGKGSKAQGDYAFALGNTSTASGYSSYAFGEGVTAASSYSYAFGKGSTTGNSYAVAMGNEASASGFSSYALGESSAASGQYSYAFGRGSKAQSSYAFALGNTATASGANSFAIGESVTASYPSSYALGKGSSATKDFAIAMGLNALASGTESFAVNGTASGNYSKSFGGLAQGSYSLTSGYNVTASGNYSTAIGYYVKATNTYAIAMGSGYKQILPPPATDVYTTASGSESIALGSQSQATKTKAVAIGSMASAKGDNSVAIGTGAEASGTGAFSIGLFTTANSFFSTSMGVFNVPFAGSATAWLPGDQLFAIGNGTTTGSESNALTILKNGKTGIGTGTGMPTHLLDVRGQMRITESNAYDVWIQGGGVTGSGYTPLRNLALIGFDEDSGDKLFVNFLSEYSGGTEVGGPVKVTGTLSVTGAMNFADPFARTIASPRYLVVNSLGEVGGSPSSSIKYKENVFDLDISDWLYDLRPVSYNYKNFSPLDIQYGLIAEEVDTVNPLLVVYGSDNKPDGLMYERLTVPMLKALQDQKKEIENLKETVKSLEMLVQMLLQEKK